MVSFETSESGPEGPARRKPLLLGLLLGVCVCALGALWIGLTFSRSIAPQERFERALAAFENGDFAELDAQARALRGVDGYQDHVHLLDGMILLRADRLSAALDEFQQAWHNPEVRDTALTLGGEALYRLGRLGDARGVLTSAVSFDSDRVDAYRWLAATEYDLGAMDDALANLQKVSELAPDDPRPYRLRGLILKDYEEFAQAVEAYRECLERNPDAETAQTVRSELADSLIALHRYDEALGVLAECAETPDTWAARAECELALGRPARARQLVERTLEAQPDHAAALMLAGDLALEDGRYDEALRMLLKARDAAPYDYVVRTKLAQVYRLQGDMERADEELAEMQRLRELRLRFARLHEQAMVDDSDAELRYELGLVAMQLGRTDLARSWFRVVLGIDPNHTRAREALAKLPPASTDAPLP